jgi:hypothetical protein
MLQGWRAGDILQWFPMGALSVGCMYERAAADAHAVVYARWFSQAAVGDGGLTCAQHIHLEQEVIWHAAACLVIR